jgi:type IX secretion system PorP/SprF family membrane protein
MKKIIILFSLYFSPFMAQDFHMSMYDAAPLFLNPAMTGLVEGDWRVHAQYRTQWKSVNFKPYTQALISFDMPYKNWGFGVQLNNFRAGFGNFNAFNALGSVAYKIDLNKRKTHHLSFGIQAGVSQKSVEYKLLTFNNQYSIANGGEFDYALANQENISAQAILNPITNVGLLYYFSKQRVKLNPFIGGSLFHLYAPKETFLSQTNVVPNRIYVHAGMRINITERFYLIPKILVQNQRKFTEQTLALDAGLFLKASEFYLLAGVVYRNKDASIFSFGIKKENFTLKMAYDLNISKLARVSQGKGGFEIALTYVHKKKQPKEAKICPRL